MLSEFNFSCFEKPSPLSINVPARFHAFCFSVDSVEIKLASTAVGVNKHGKRSGTLTYEVDMVMV